MTLVDSYSWTQHAATTYGRCPDGTGAFTVTAASTQGARNECGSVPPVPSPSQTGPSQTLPAAGAIVVNEVESNGDDAEWFELFNTTGAPIDLAGFIVRDNDDSKRYDLPAGSVVPSRGILLVDQLTAHNSARPIAINEVESNGGTPRDWIELVNLSGGSISAGGLDVTDSDIAGHRYTIPAGTTVSAGGRLVLDEAAFGFGLGAADEVHLFDVDGVDELDATSWSAHAAATWGRCPDATGAFAVTAEPTKDAANRCAGEVAVEPWPGGADVRVLDDEATFSGDPSRPTSPVPGPMRASRASRGCRTPG
ncbi:lamin tail domain-containing protein [Microbacterium lacticum]